MVDSGDKQELMAQILDTLKTKVSEFNYNNWFKASHWFYEQSTESSLLPSGPIPRILIQVPSKFVRDWICENYLEIIKFEFFKLTGVEHEIIIKVGPAADLPTAIPSPLFQQGSLLSDRQNLSDRGKIDPKKGGEARPKSHGASTLPSHHRLRFENFVVGGSNQFVHAACQAVASAPARNYNPLFIYSGVGLGKTHLLNAISSEVSLRHPHWKIRLLTGEEFTNEVINSIRYQKTFELRQKYRSFCDLLLIDDVQFIAGKERTMEEFFHTFNALYEARKQIVLSCDVLPKDISQLEERLRSRFSWGLMADIQPPDLETRIAILKKKAEEENIALSDEVCHLIASHIKTNVRDLEGSLIRISAMASLSSHSMTVDLAREILKQTLPSLSSSLSIETIQEMVANYYQLRINDLKSPHRHKKLSLPRQIAMYLCKKHIKASYPEIGEKFGGKDHTTVIHAFHKIEDLVSSDYSFRENMEHLEGLLSHQA